MDGKSLNILHDQLEKLKQFFPEAVTESKIDWEKLQATLGKENIEFLNERYVLNWAGKSDAFKILQQTTTATLKPIKEESINFDTTENIFIEGENLEVLKVLQKAYYGKVKVICIDPPYNTGNDSFIYPDSFKESKEDYKKRIGDVDEEGYLMKEGMFRRNSKDSGHYHSNWLSMMYPRLFLAKNLLRDDGVIFVHIDDNEVHNLRLIMNEIFGEENFIANIIWHSKYTTSNDAKYISRQHESILFYSKDIFSFDIGLLERTKDMDASYSNPDNDIRGVWKATPLHAKSGSGGYSITFPNGITWTPPQGRFPRYSKDRLIEMYYDNRITFGRDLKATPSAKTYLSEVKSGKTVGSLWSFKDVGSSHQANENLAEVMEKGMFDNPKPVKIIRQEIIVANTKKEDIVLDFFSGSATTAQAVLEQNKGDGGNRKFILVQLPEKCEEESEAYKAGYKTISDIGKERIRRVIKKLRIENEELRMKEEGRLPLDNSQLSTINSQLDLGFKVFKLSTSNFKIWRGK
ncbi:MAG: site-specific DNA-methyltransferase, partial [Actinobacteria bacterium]|nr:site-specific DNA-methyltransferase [Actinomycetota bacterium]